MVVGGWDYGEIVSGWEFTEGFLVFGGWDLVVEFSVDFGAQKIAKKWLVSTTKKWLVSSTENISSTN